MRRPGWPSNGTNLTIDEGGTTRSSVLESVSDCSLVEDGVVRRLGEGDLSHVL